MAQPIRPTQWWHAVDRRTFGKGALAFAALVSLSGCKGEEEVNTESLDLQRQHGWNVGAESSRLFFVGTSEQDATGSSDWKPYTDPTRLMDAWRPRTEAWQAFFTPTLIQALQASSLREQIRPVFTRAMAEAFGRGEALRKDLLSQVTRAEETLFIADLPGPEAVAYGAGLASWADVVVNFDNWPHPHGVVRSHETLAAMLYYAAYMEQHKQQLPASAPGLLLLDNQRLTPYTDDGSQFDNRYLATVPSAAALRQRGIKHVLYIVPDRKQQDESDDLNDDFVAYKNANIQVAVLPLSDLQKTTEPVAKTAPDGTTRTVQEPRYYYGGGLESHLGFLLLYSFLAPRPTLYYPYPVASPPYPVGPGGGISYGDLRRPTTVQPPSYEPRTRPTMFSGTRTGGQSGVGRAKPSGFGRTTVRTSGGRVTGVSRRGAASGRSGSFGRGGTGSSGA
ncbi:MAG TPA: hypothetical protein VIH59_16405 [Candidatus Tectomicrobia bacterium]|jgi:hypothetical protein